MADPIAPFRPGSVALLAGVSTDTAGVAATARITTIPQLAIDARVGAGIGVTVGYGADLVVRPLAGAFAVTPTIRAGYTYDQTNNFIFGGSTGATHVGTAALGLEWKAPCGFTLSADAGYSLRSGSQNNGFAFTLGLGYTFPIVDWITGQR